jgi:S1-C subfamily serine protease
VELQTVSGELDSSDHISFQAAGIPAVQLFSGVHLDYHKPSDTVDRVDVDGLVKVASVAKEAVEYLASREEPLTGALTRGRGDTGTRGNGGGEGPFDARSLARGVKDKAERKVSLGTIPDFTYEGEGVRLEGVAPGSPAERAGLIAGDIIVELDDEKVGDLKALSNILKAHSAGDTLRIVFLRNGVERSVEGELVPR